MTPPWWQRWLLPERPGVRQFALGALALLLPLPALLFGPDHVIPAMAAGITLGVGLGLGWLLLFARRWLKSAPIAALGVYAVCFGCLLLVAVLPRWELLLRVQATKRSLERWELELRAGTAGSPPTYHRGEDRPACRPGPPGSGVLLYTADSLQRWSLIGWRNSAYLLLYDNGTVTTVWKEADLERLLAGRNDEKPETAPP